MKKPIIFKTAWKIFNDNGIRTMEAWSEALSKAWMNNKFGTYLNDHSLEFKFKKIDGSTRIAKGTRNLDLIPEEFHPKGTAPEATEKRNEKIVAYFDFDKKSWRSFKRESLISFKLAA